MTNPGDSRQYVSADFSHSIGPDHELTREEVWASLKGKLTSREWLCVKGMLDGKTQAEISAATKIDQGDVCRCLAGAYAKMRDDKKLIEHLQSFVTEDEDGTPRNRGHAAIRRDDHQDCMNGRQRATTWNRGNRDDS